MNTSKELIELEEETLTCTYVHRDNLGRTRSRCFLSICDAAAVYRRRFQTAPYQYRLTIDKGTRRGNDRNWQCMAKLTTKAEQKMTMTMKMKTNLSTTVTMTTTKKTALRKSMTGSAWHWLLHAKPQLTKTRTLVNLKSQLLKAGGKKSSGTTYMQIVPKQNCQRLTVDSTITANIQPILRNTTAIIIAARQNTTTNTN